MILCFYAQSSKLFLWGKYRNELFILKWPNWKLVPRYRWKSGFLIWCLTKSLETFFSKMNIFTKESLRENTSLTTEQQAFAANRLEIPLTEISDLSKETGSLFICGFCKYKFCQTTSFILLKFTRWRAFAAFAMWPHLLQNWVSSG